jgi:predicted nuclease with RNAse H fold
MRRVVGIDWATKKKDRALVALDVKDDGRAVVEAVRPSLSDEEAVAACTAAENTVVAVDIPFGWPIRFSEFVSRWRPGTESLEPPPSDDFRFRRTDRIVRAEVPKQPLSVSADRIAMGARSWTALLTRPELSKRVSVDGSVLTDLRTLIEVYPGASAVVLGGERSVIAADESYKSDANTRRKLVRHIASACGVNLARYEDEVVSQAKDSDETDAFLAAVTAAIYLSTVAGIAPTNGWTIRRPRMGDEVDDARREGWIFFPVRADAPAQR